MLAKNHGREQEDHYYLRSNSQGMNDIMIKVMFSDGSLGMISPSRLVKLIKLNKIAAYQPFDVWVEVRRKGNSGNYRGPERRKTSIQTFKSC